MTLREVAKRETAGLSDLFEGREKVDKEARDNLLERKLTIEDFDIVNYNDGKKDVHMCAVVFAEEPTICYCGGQQLTRILDSYVIGGFKGDVRLARDAYEKEEKVVVILEKTTTRSGNNFVKVTVE